MGGSGKEAVGQIATEEDAATIAAYRAVFESGQFREEVEKAVAQTADRSPSIQALETVIESLKQSNESLRTRLDAEWERPKRLFNLIAIVAGFFFAIHWGQEFFAVSELSSRAEALRTDSQKIRELNDRYQNQLSDAQVVSQITMSAHTAIHRSVLETARATDELVYRDDPIRAARLAIGVADSLTDEVSRLKQAEATLKSRWEGKDDLVTALRDGEKRALSVYGECLVQSGKLLALDNTSRRILSIDADDSDGHYFAAIAQLAKLDFSRVRSDDGESIPQLPELGSVIVDFRHAAAAGNGTAGLLLALCHLNRSEFKLARKEAEDVLTIYSAAGTRRDPQFKAIATIADAITVAADLLASPDSHVAIPLVGACRTGDGVLEKAEGQMIKSFIALLRMRRKDLLDDFNSQARVGILCLMLERFIDNACGGSVTACSSGFCGGTATGYVSDTDWLPLAAAAGLSFEPWKLTEIGVTADVPRLSNDSSLGRVVGSERIMHLMRFESVDLKVVVTVNGAIEEYETTLQCAVISAVGFPTERVVPEGLYVPFGSLRLDTRLLVTGAPVARPVPVPAAPAPAPT